jgi:diguanylate cyclase (GGDEF)-like protein
MSETDRCGLTGLFNYRKLQADLASALRASKAVTFILADLDDFKRVNDTYGYEVGDSVLCTVASTMAGTCAASRSCLGPYRLGGEAFCAILTNVDADLAMEFADTLRVGVEQIRIDGPGIESDRTTCRSHHSRLTATRSAIENSC